MILFLANLLYTNLIDREAFLGHFGPRGMLSHSQRATRDAVNDLTAGTGHNLFQGKIEAQAHTPLPLPTPHAPHGTLQRPHGLRQHATGVTETTGHSTDTATATVQPTATASPTDAQGSPTTPRYAQSDAQRQPQGHRPPLEAAER